MSTTQIFTNREGNTLIKKLEGVFAHVPNIAVFDVLVGYFRASGYFRVRTLLDKVPKVRILVGIDVDRLTKQFHDRGQQYLLDPKQTKEEFVTGQARNIQEASYDEATERGLMQFLDDLLSEKIELRAHPEKRIHAKLYIVRPEPFNEYTPAEFVTGSSNLTATGLGLNEHANYEFNISARDYPLVREATDEFELLWQESVPILKADAEALRRRTYLRDDFTPHELFIKMLIEYFGQRVDFDPYNIEMMLPPTYYRLRYQIDAASQGYAIMMVHNGFLLADVVGLGKTIIALMVAKKFILENGVQTKVLVVCPPALENSWRRTARDFQVDNHFQVITNGSLNRVLNEDDLSFHSADQYDLVVVDESHKFRNDYTGMYLELQEICKRPRVRRAANGDDRKKVILVSATPLNNSPADIENQLYVFQDRRNSTLRGVRNLQAYFTPIKQRYKDLAAEPKLNLTKLKALFAQLRADIIEPLVIRRTRKDIEDNPEYLADLKAQGIKFPKVNGPAEVNYQLDTKLARLFAETVEMVTGEDEFGVPIPNGFAYYRYRAIEFLADQPAAKALYGDPGNISRRLANIMRILLVKRLESSLCAFRGSLGRLHKAIGNMLAMFENDRIFIAPDLDVNKLLEEGYTYDEIEAKIEAREGNNRTFVAEQFQPEFVDLLRAEQQKVSALLQRWQAVRHDPKLDEFIRLLPQDFLNPKQNPTRQLVIFTESTETAADLQACLQKHGYDRVLSISAANRKEQQKAIEANFDANYKGAWAHDYDIIITTEVLAEGINLHRANVIVNYDVPWNATRLMQRIGRVNRIGSLAEVVYVHNFYPSAHGDTEIGLVSKALRKLQAFHSAFGEDNKVFSVLEEVGEGRLFGSMGQLEESEIEKYLRRLREFRSREPKRFREIAALPHKARCGRDEQHVPPERRPVLDVDSGARYALAGASAAYFKAENHPGAFCLVPPTGQPVELTFLEAARLFDAAPTEAPVPLPDYHHRQTAQGLDFFRSEKVQQQVRDTRVDRRQLNNTENQAIQKLTFAGQNAANAQQRALFLAARRAVEAGAFAAQGLPAQINQFFAGQGAIKPAAVAAVLLDFEGTVLAPYNLTNAAPATDGSAPVAPAVTGLISPNIVLTVSFAALVAEATA